MNDNQVHQAAYIPGLEGVVAAQTRLSHVDGEAGELLIAGFPLEEIAPYASFEEAVYLLWNGELPTAGQLDDFRALLAESRLPGAVVDVLRAAVSARADGMDALRMAAGLLSLDLPPASQGLAQDATLLARLPAVAATWWRLRSGLQPLEPPPDMGLAAGYLYMLRGSEPHPAQVRALETYFNTVIDHGLNASTFTARVIISTGSDLVSALVGAVGALKGPLHGGAPGPALQMVFEIAEPDQAEAYLRKKLDSGQRLMGFGHRIYKVRDQRASVLASAAEILYRQAGDMQLYELAQAVERKALELLEEYKPGRRLQTNVEFYTALLLHGLGIPLELFTPTFTTGRAAGWIAHCREQQRQNRLIRPQSQYTGPGNRRWVPLEMREGAGRSGAS